MKNINQNKLLIFLKLLEKNKVDYVIWKNLHKLEQSFDGFFNIDLFVPISQKDKFIEILKLSNCIKAKHAINNFPFVNHYYLLGENNEFFHIHTYHKLITGESILKEFILPIENLILENKVKHKKFNIWVVNKEINAYIFIIRHFLKNSSFLGRNLYKREINSYKDEWESINLKRKEILYEMPFIKKDTIEKSNLFNSNFQLPNLIAAYQFRNSIKNYCRFNKFQIFFKRNNTFIKLIINKYITKKKKLLSQSGIIISFSGVDGSGKSTINNYISNFFKGFMTVENYHIGKPQGILITNILSKIRKETFHKKGKKVKKETSFFSSIIAISVAILRNLMAKKIKRKTDKGFLLFVDRWPTNQLNCMDGPRIYISSKKNFIIHFLRSFESYIYNNFLKADLCIFFKVNLETALKRNLNRKKINKETQDQIIKRFYKNSSVKPIAKKIIYFDNNLEYQDSVNKILNIIWAEISDFSFDDNFL